ncbi:helix-turn-helix transcriptional regulator [Dokdonella sp.]|uniref:helix-turn-helix transcriptional regulator n=1 Tax=Dokdonella sp. TaxID=2291710 RepID=UPI003526F58C
MSWQAATRESEQSQWRLQYVDACYAAALGSDPLALSGVLRQVVERIGAAMSFLQVMHTSDSAMQPIAAWGVPQPVLEDYALHFADNDPWLKLFATNRLRWGQVACTGNLTDIGEVDMGPLKMTPYFNEFWRRWGLLHTAGTFTEIAPGKIVSLGTPRYDDAGSLRPGDYPDFAFAASHLVRVVSIQQRMSSLEAIGARSQSVLDRLDFGLMLLDARGRITQTNRPAEALLQPGGPLCSRTGHLVFRDAAIQQRILEELDLSALRGNRRSLHAVDPFVIISASWQRWVVFVLPWHSSTSNQWALLFFDEHNQARDAGKALSVLGALTPAEGEVLQGMLQGLTSSEIANQRNTSTETARTQIKSVLHKLGLRSQSELLRLAARFAMPLRDSGESP